ncbi:hypothetical protein WJX81_005429 [Elliptochloris bilobata]|uniref:VASt domain-containing protein n=1 Tax=Elliptochloris bilobata TaxID=381761 RepID=A0AAW1S1P6_9CHLO
MPSEPGATNIAEAADADSEGSVATEAGTASLPPPLEHVLLDETLPLDVKALWRLVMADGQFWREFQERRQARGLVMSGWSHAKADSKRAGLERRLEYTVPVKRSRLGPREARCEEAQRCERRGADGFHVHVVARTPEVPCGTCFHQELQWVATPAGKGRTRVVVSARVVFTRPLFGMRGLIESSSLEGMRDTYCVLSTVLRQRLAAALPVIAVPDATPAPVLACAGAGGPCRRDALLTQLAARAPAWRALFLSALFALRGLWCGRPFCFVLRGAAALRTVTRGSVAHVPTATAPLLA